MAEHRAPRLTERVRAAADLSWPRITAPASGDTFLGPELGPQWSWRGNPDPSWWSQPGGPDEFGSPGGPGGFSGFGGLGGGWLRLACYPSPYADDLRLLPSVLTQRFPAEAFVATTSVTLRSEVAGARAGFAVLGDAYAWTGLERRTGCVVLVHRRADAGAPEADATTPVPVPAGATVRLGVSVEAGALCRFTVDLGGGPEPIGAAFTAAKSGRWVGAALAVFATAGAAPHRTAAAAAAAAAAAQRAAARPASEQSVPADPVPADPVPADPAAGEPEAGEPGGYAELHWFDVRGCPGTALTARH